MCFEDLVKRRHHPKSRAGNIRQLLALCQRGSRVDLENRRLTSRQAV